MSVERHATIEAKPPPITVNTTRTAVIVVDMQIDSKGGMSDRAGVKLASRETGTKIVYLKMGFRADLSDLGDSDSANLMVGRDSC